MEEDRDTPAQAGDEAAWAFERLRREVALQRRAIEGLAETIDVPDYGPTLANTERLLQAVLRRLEAIAPRPAPALAPQMPAERPDAAVGEATRAPRDAPHMRLDRAAWRLVDRRGWLAALAGLGLGMLLGLAFAGPLAGALPARWHGPERLATRALAAPSMWAAGQRLMTVADPEAWRGVVASDKIVRDNQETIDACRKAADKAKKAVSCTIEVKAGT